MLERYVDKLELSTFSTSSDNLKIWIYLWKNYFEIHLIEQFDFDENIVIVRHI